LTAYVWGLGGGQQPPAPAPVEEAPATDMPADASVEAMPAEAAAQ